MQSNFSKKLIPKPGQILFISYVDENNQTLTEFYCRIDASADDYHYFTITDWVRGNEENLFNEDIQLGWSTEQFAGAYINIMERMDLIELGRCPKCAKMGYFGPRAAFMCPTHGAWGGLG